MCDGDGHGGKCPVYGKVQGSVQIGELPDHEFSRSR